MSTLFGLLGTMSDSMQAQQAGLNVTGQNVANVNTPGYVRRTAQLETEASLPGNQGSVLVTGTLRSFDQFTFAQVVQQSGLKGAADSRSQALSSAQAVLSPQGGGDIGSALTAFFSSLSTLSASPSDPSARAAVLAQATSLAQTVSTTAAGLTSQQQQLLGQAQGAATSLNADLSQIAQLNTQIAQANAQGDSAPDLRDQQSALLSKVATAVGGQVIYDASGQATVLAAGTTLVEGGNASSLSVTQSSTGTMQILATSSGGSATDITSGVDAGTLGGLREARDTDIASAAAQLDKFAYDLTGAINAVHSSGYGLDGVTGRNLFTAQAQVAGAAARMAVDPSVAGNPSAVAAAASAADVPGGNDVAVALAQLANQTLGTGGTPADRFGNIGAQLGSAAATAASDATTRANTLTQAQNLDSSASGVSLAEENVNLTKFQQAFQASTQVLQVADGLLTNLMSMMSAVGA